LGMEMGVNFLKRFSGFTGKWETLWVYYITG
jgi:hypothetical protein